MKPKILISHPGRQHSHQLVYALHNSNYTVHFITSIWYKPSKFYYKFLDYLPNHKKKIIIDELNKRYFKGLNDLDVIQFPYFEIIRQSLKFFIKSENLVNLVNRTHDYYVSYVLKKIRPDIIIGYEISSKNSFLKARNMGITTILDMPSAPYWFQEKVLYDSDDRKNYIRNSINKIKQSEINTADYIFTPSNYVRDLLLCSGIKREKINQIPYGVDINLFQQKIEYQINKEFIVLYVGRISKEKGIENLLKTFKELNLKNSKMILIGNIENAGKILEKYKRFFVHYNFLNHKELKKQYQNADILVQPSPMEGFSQVVLEAMACGTPVIVTKNSGSSDAVLDGESGFIISIHDTEELMNKILYFYNNRSEIEKFGKRARMQAEKYTWGKYRKKVVESIANIWKKNSTFNV